MRAATRYIVIFAFITLVVLVWFFWDSPESAIRAVLRKGEAAVESKDMAGAMSHLSRHYLDENGLNYLAVRRVLGVAFNRFQHIDVRLGSATININGDKAIAKVPLQVVVQMQRGNAYAVGAPGAPDVVTIAFVKEPLAWRVLSVNGIDVSRLGL